MTGKVALVAGASGIIGRGVLDALRDRPDWQVRALGRRPMDGVDTVAADLLDPEAARQALRRAADTTHLFFAAYSAQPDLAAEVRVNGPMLENLLDGLHGAGAPLQRVVLYQGAKVYGVHLGKIEAPFHEDTTPRHLPPNFYYTQEDALRRRGPEQGFAWSILRPDVVVGDAVGNPMSIAMVIGVLAAISKATGTPLRFPGPHQVYTDRLAQVTDARLLGRASLWVAEADAARGEAFNYVQEPFRWKQVWERVGQGLGIEVGPPMPMRLATHMAFLGDVWERIAREHGLRGPSYSELVGWPFGDFVFNTGFDMVSDMGKIRRAGFAETTDSADAILAAISRLRERKVLP